jgi:hypothetical protein
MDTTPYYADFELVQMLDRESFSGESYQLSEEQFREIVRNFQMKNAQMKNLRDGKLVMQKLATYSAFIPKGGCMCWLIEGLIWM